LNSGLCACKSGALPLESRLQSQMNFDMVTPSTFQKSHSDSTFSCSFRNSRNDENLAIVNRQNIRFFFFLVVLGGLNSGLCAC
jgi:hypothetical protein